MVVATLLSVLILGAITIPAGVGLSLLIYDELKFSVRATDGYGFPVVLGFLLVFVIMPILVFVFSK